MELLRRLYGYPHEALHVLALWLIGRRAVRATGLHVDVPDDLTTGQYVFVAGLPALVFGGAALLGVLALLNAHTLAQAALAWLAIILMGIGVAGTAGDVQMIVLRLENAPKKEEGSRTED